MKNLYKILFVSALAVAAAACSELNTTPVFEESESFAYIVGSSYGLNENSGQVVIPVQIASISPVKTQVSYVITDGTAKKGVDYEDTNASAVLSFDGTTREQSIVINIFDRSGEYTGDLGFSVSLVSATGLKLSEESACSITIYDLDHPLAAILGEYTVSCHEHWQGDVTYTMSLTKDPKDVTVVWCNGICPMVAGASAYSPVYGNVTKDEETGKYSIAFPGGQVMAKDFQGDGDLILCETYYKGGYYVDDTATIEFTQTGDVVFESTNGMGVVTNSYVWQGGFVYGATTAEGYKTVWTKK